MYILNYYSWYMLGPYKEFSVKIYFIIYSDKGYSGIRFGMVTNEHIKISIVDLL